MSTRPQGIRSLASLRLPELQAFKLTKIGISRPRLFAHSAVTGRLDPRDFYPLPL